MWVKISGHKNYSINKKGQIRNDTTGHIKKPTLNKSNGYYCVDLYENNKSVKVPVHRLIATAFIPNPDNRPTVDHKDGNRTNNAVSNLRWATYSEQNSRFDTLGVRSQKVKATHYIENRKKRGNGHVSWGAVDRILFFDRVTDCAEYFGCCIGNVSQRIKSGDVGRRGRTRAWLIEYSE